MSRATASDRGATVVGDLALRLANQVIEACARRDIVLMPLKGVLLLGRWPGLLGRRDLVDFDLLVRAEDLEGVTLALDTLGFKPTVHTSAGTTFASDSWPLTVDVHHRLFPHGLFGMSTEGTFHRAEPDASLFAAPIARMSDADLIAHLVGHFVKGRGAFTDDTSLSDIRWILDQDLLRPEMVGALGRHLRSLGLQRAAGYTLGHPTFRDEPIATEVLRSLALSRADRAVIALAVAGTRGNGGTPPWWTPHLLNHSLLAGSRSLADHVNEAGRRSLAHLTHRWGSKLRRSSGIRATR